MSNPKPDIEAAIGLLCSLHEGDRGVLATIACGKEAIPRLKAILLKSEPSGLFETRCRAVTALKALGAGDVLAAFLAAPDVAADPVRRLGDEAVVEAAARAFAGRNHDDASFLLLLRLAHAWPHLAGVVEALGGFGRPEAVPVLVAALDEDTSRHAAEDALLRIGAPALPLLVAATMPFRPSADNESEGSRRKRRSALNLIAQIDDAGRAWPQLRNLMEDGDPCVSFLACRLCLVHGSAAERSRAIGRMRGLLPTVDWVLREDIRECLAAIDKRE